jgi:hypothetical protein
MASFEETELDDSHFTMEEFLKTSECVKETMSADGSCLCKNCEKKIALKSFAKDTTLPVAIHCRWCDGWEKDDEDDDYAEGNANDPLTAKSFYCRSCTRKCWHCEVRGCRDCVNTVCCDCSVSMCDDCRNSDILCGCYGECYSCGREVDRGSDGWPCDDCDKWYCRGCRYGDNDCQECNPRDEESSDESSEEEEEEEEEETSEETSQETSEGSDSCNATKETSKECDSCNATLEEAKVTKKEKQD